MSEVIKVGMADLAVCSGDDAVTTLGLGSCIGIAIRDPGTGIGGLVHIMLPSSTEIRNNSNRPKFADTGIEDLVDAIIKKGGNRNRLEAKIAGGAQMFASSSKSDTIRVGERNAMASKEKLSEMHIPLLAEDTGKTYGRTVIFYPKTGDYVIRSIGQPEKVI